MKGTADVLELKNVTKRFGATGPVLADLSFKVEPGSITALGCTPRVGRA